MDCFSAIVPPQKQERDAVLALHVPFLLRVHSPSLKRAKRRTIIFSPVLRIKSFTRSATLIFSSLNQGCVINAIASSSFGVLPSATSAGISSRVIYLGSSAATWRASSLPRLRNSSLRETKSVLQLSSSSTPRFPAKWV